MERPGRQIKSRQSDKDKDLPNVLEYLDYRQFLRDRFQALQSLGARYTQRAIAKQAGFKSPHLLSMIVSGQRNLAVSMVPALSKALKLDDRDGQYFDLIVSLSHAESEEQRTDILERIQVGFHNGIFKEIQDESLEILRYWYLPALREVVTIKPDAGVEWMSDQLGLTREQVKHGLKILLDKGYLRREGKTYLRAEPSIHTPERIYPLIIANYNLQILQQAFKAHGHAREKRYFESLTFAMPKSLMPDLIEHIKRFFREVDVLVESHSTREEVCQLNLQLFPLTRWQQVKVEEKLNDAI